MNRRSFFKVCGAGAVSALAALLGKRGIAEPIQDDPGSVEAVMSVDWAAGHDETATAIHMYGPDSYYWIPLKAGINEPANIQDMWVDGESVYIYDSEKEYYVCPRYFDTPEVIWWFCMNLGEVRLKHLENLRGRLALFQTLWSTNAERTEEVGREIEHLARIMDQVVKEVYG